MTSPAERDAAPAPGDGAQGAPRPGAGLAAVRGLPPGIAIFLAYGVLLLALIALSLPAVVEQAVVIPISPIGVVVMALLAYTIFTLTLTLQRKEAARPLALGLSSLTLPGVPLLLMGGLPIVAALLALLAFGLFRGLTTSAARSWLNEP